MSVRVEYEGVIYRFSGNEWLNSTTYMPPPKVVQRELNARFRHLIVEPVKRTSQRSTTSAKSKSILQTIGPLIIEFIRNRFTKTGNFVHRDEIVHYLVQHKKASAFLHEAHKQTAQQMTFEQYVGNQIDWLSARFETLGKTDFHTLEKVTMLDGKKGYGIRWHDFEEGRIYHRQVVVEAIQSWLPQTGEEKRKSKQDNLELIAAGPEKIKYQPFGEGWGRSPANAKCWENVETGKRLK